MLKAGGGDRSLRYGTRRSIRRARRRNWRNSSTKICSRQRSTETRVECTKKEHILSWTAFADSYTPQFSLSPAPCNSSSSSSTPLSPLPGGKGTPRRKVQAKKGTVGEDKKLQAALKKLNVQPVSGIEEVNMFREDGNVLHFKQPKGELAGRCSRGAHCMYAYMLTLAAKLLLSPPL